MTFSQRTNFLTRSVVLALALVAAACSDTNIRTAKAVINISPAQLDFGTKAPTSKTGLALTILNTGTAPLTLTAADIKNDTRSAFTVGELPPSVAQGASVVIEVTYNAPAVPGNDLASLLFASNADNGTATGIPLIGRSGDASCADALKNGEESDMDCGGTKCPGCKTGGICAAPGDCDVGLGCVAGKCGTCSDGSQCRAGQICAGGVCTGCKADAECAAGSTCESGACTVCPGATGAIDTRTDVKNCGRCGNACPVPLNAGALCLASKCGRTPCQSGFYDLTSTFGCESICHAHICTDELGHQTTISNDPLPETGNVFRALSSGSSYGDKVETGPHFTNIGALGESTPPAVGGATRQTGTHFQNIGGLKSTQK
jgi:hypothetical protein